jgi:hypothetical protein
MLYDGRDGEHWASVLLSSKDGRGASRLQGSHAGPSSWQYVLYVGLKLLSLDDLDLTFAMTFTALQAKKTRILCFIKSLGSTSM